MKNYENISRIFQICGKLLEVDEPREAIKYFDSSISTEIKIGKKNVAELAILYHEIKAISEKKRLWNEFRNCLLSLIDLYSVSDFENYKIKIFEHYQEIINLMINTDEEKVNYLKLNIEVAKSLNDKIYIANAYKDIAQLFQDPKIHKKAGAAYLELGPLYYKQAYNFYRCSAELYRKESINSKACTCYEKVIYIYIKRNGQKATKELMEYFQFINKFTDAKYFETLFFNSLLSENSEPAIKSSLYLSFCEILKSSNKRFDLIEKYLLLSLDEQLNFTEPKEVIQVCEKLSEDFKSLNIETSLNLKLKAISLLGISDKSNFFKLSKMYHELGVRYKDLGLDEKSIECFEKSLKFAKSSENPLSNKIVMDNELSIAEIMEKKKKISKAQYHRLIVLKINDREPIVDDKIIFKNISIMEKNEKTIGTNLLSAEFFELKNRFFNKNNVRRFSQTTTPNSKEKLNKTIL